MLMALPQTDIFHSSAYRSWSKLLLQRGADVNGRINMGDGFSAIHCCLDGIRNRRRIRGRAALLRELLGIYMAAGADLTAKSAEAIGSYTPLGMALECNSWCGGLQWYKATLAFETVKLLLRHGASIDACLQGARPDALPWRVQCDGRSDPARTEAQDRHRQSCR